MKSTMQDYPLTITSIYRRGRDIFGPSEVVTLQGDSSRRASFASVSQRAEKLAAGLRRLGIREGDRVGTLSWNNQEHQEAYLAVPCMGAVLHTLNLRLAPEQLAWVINHAEDRAIIVDGSLVPMLAKIKDQLRTVEHCIVTGRDDVSALGDVIRYEDLIERETSGFRWPELDERSAASMCYTTGTTGDPKGVVYSHRSVYLHSLAQWGAFSLTDADRLLVIVPMFHVNAWGFPYTAWMLGADLLMPSRFLQADPLCKFIQQERPTVAFGVPTVWSDVLRHVDANQSDLSSLRLVVCGGSAVPRSLMEQFQERHGVRIIQAWGMTETSPVAAIAFPPRGATAAEEMDWRVKTGRIVAGVELRTVDDEGQTLPADGQSVGELEVRGPWITGSYYRVDAPDKFHDGWLKTGDVGHVDGKGFVQITDRSKDVIKSGGEWISSVELENALAGHPEVVEATVVGVPDERWQERPLALVVLKPGAGATPADLHTFLGTKVARWWVPERWAVVAEIPKTSVGKYNKKVVRAMYAEGKLPVVELITEKQR
ncbi:MAG TPA: long-chain fatty acid--CoA ligase [Candidatus Dormibacteraeota bacterium]|nr:long-chain fatty acid--CoA ligase [Candidatus Dormibacteraeota bacterium]